MADITTKPREHDGPREPKSAKKQGKGFRVLGDVTKKFGEKLAECVKNPSVKPLNGSRRAIRLRIEASTKRGKSPPKRGDVTRGIMKDAAKATKDAAKAALCCGSAMDVDSGLRDLPFPTKKEAAATLWPTVDTLSWELHSSDPLPFW